jgi:epoxyqueuosine reductase
VRSVSPGDSCGGFQPENSTSYDESVRSDVVRRLAQECGFELAGVARAEPVADDFGRYETWVAEGMAGEMRYLTDRRAEVRRDPRNLLAGARSVICVGKLYNRAVPPVPEGHAVISRYAWGRDYHYVLRDALEQLARKLAAIEPHDWKICVDTAPLLERSYARQAGLGWIGRNTCLINEPLGSWFFLGELITTLDLEPGSPPPDRCGTCTRCIEACPTQAIVPKGEEWTLDARRCISYLNIELRGPIPEEFHAAFGPRVFGCDICQEVCPWNSRAPETSDPAFAPRYDPAPPLEELARLSAEEFAARYRDTPVTRPKYDGFLRNVAVAIASGSAASRPETLSECIDS